MRSSSQSRGAEAAFGELDTEIAGVPQARSATTDGKEPKRRDRRVAPANVHPERHHPIGKMIAWGDGVEHGSHCQDLLLGLGKVGPVAAVIGLRSRPGAVWTGSARLGKRKWFDSRLSLTESGHGHRLHLSGTHRNASLTGCGIHERCVDHLRPKRMQKNWERARSIEAIISGRAAAKRDLWLPHMPTSGQLGLGHLEMAAVSAEAGKTEWVPSC